MALIVPIDIKRTRAFESATEAYDRWRQVHRLHGEMVDIHEVCSNDYDQDPSPTNWLRLCSRREQLATLAHNRQQAEDARTSAYKLLASIQANGATR